MLCYEIQRIGHYQAIKDELEIEKKHDHLRKLLNTNKIILKNLNTYGRNFSAEQILNAIVLLRDCDLIIKTTSINEKYFFYSILVEVCEGSGV